MTRHWEEAHISRKTQTITLALLLGLATLLSAGCAKVGREFPVASVPRIELNVTTQEQVRDLFGAPWRTGIEDGMRTWTYARYRYALFSETQTTDLLIRFNDQGIVVSYAFNTTEHDERGD